MYFPTWKVAVSKQTWIRADRTERANELSWLVVQQEWERYTFFTDLSQLPLSSLPLNPSLSRPHPPSCQYHSTVCHSCAHARVSKPIQIVSTHNPSLYYNWISWPSSRHFILTLRYCIKSGRALTDNYPTFIDILDDGPLSASSIPSSSSSSEYAPSGPISSQRYFYLTTTNDAYIRCVRRRKTTKKSMVMFVSVYDLYKLRVKL
jgi:hypothetical protein